MKGSIEPGKLADLVVLGRDLFPVATGFQLKGTMVGGKWVWEYCRICTMFKDNQ